MPYLAIPCSAPNACNTICWRYDFAKHSFRPTKRNPCLSNHLNLPDNNNIKDVKVVTNANLSQLVSIFRSIYGDEWAVLVRRCDEAARDGASLNFRDYSDYNMKEN